MWTEVGTSPRLLEKSIRQRGQPFRVIGVLKQVPPAGPRSS